LPRPTNRQLAAREAENQKRERYAAQEAKRATRIQIDQNAVLKVWVGGIIVAFITAAIISFNGITNTAYAVGLSFTWMAYLFFFFIELMYLIFLAAYLIVGSRGESATGAFWGMVFFAGVAVAANAWHTMEYHQFTWLNAEMWAGVVLSVSAPIAIIASSKMASRVALAQTIKED
jgi:hypothetical protein